jgi:hypothetical protein
MALIQELTFFRRPYFKVLHRVSHARSVFGMERPDVIFAAAKHVEAAFQSGPSQRRKSYAANPGLANHPSQLIGVRIEHFLVGHAHQKTSGHAVPECAARLHNTAASQLQEPRQCVSRKLRARGILFRKICFE